MVGPEAEHSGIIRAGARFVEAMATARVPKIVLTVNHASGAGYYAMAGQGFDPDFIFSWPTGRMGVMEGESAVMAVHGPRSSAANGRSARSPPEVQQAMDEMRADYEHQLDARYAAARGFHRRHCLPRRNARRARYGAAGLAPIRRSPSRRVRASTDEPAEPAVSDRVVRVAAGQGFWGDWLEAPCGRSRAGRSTT